jgi:hypothetical protein
MVSPQRTLRYPYNKVQGPPIIVGWTMVVTLVSTTPAWGIEPTTSSLGAMSPYHQAKAVVPLYGWTTSIVKGIDTSMIEFDKQ